MFTVPLRPPESRRTPIARRREVDVQLATGGRSLSSHSLIALPKNLIASLSRAGSLAMPVSEALLLQQRARTLSGMRMLLFSATQ
jgi:hypothetical protein